MPANVRPATLALLLALASAGPAGSLEPEGGIATPLARLLATHGADLADLADAPVDLELLDGAGVRLVRVPLGLALAAIDGVGPVSTDHLETTVGNVGHGYLNEVARGGGDPRAYRITVSSLAPEVPALEPPHPVGILVFEPGGPLVQVQGTYDDGQHTVGTGVGSNVATGPGGPYLPVRDGDSLRDHKIEFLGHAYVAQATLCLSDVCLGFGGLRGFGVAVFDVDAVTLPPLPT